MHNEDLGFNSLAVHAGKKDDCMNSAVSPIYQTSTFSFDSADHGAKCFSGEDKGYIYTRIGNPTINELEDAVAKLENGFGGIAVSSGMAAVNTVYLTYLGMGKHLLAHNSLYGPSRAIMESLYPRFGVESTFVDATNAENVEKAIRPETS
ncbi:MAG: PLP-dependent transferase, partial [Bacteroidales bacterium]|nr:PLP-dependent transferase [Bacteroidales bacterium]